MDEDRLSRAFAALADPTRRALIAQLTSGDATVSDLAAPHEMSLQAVSKHLRVLGDAGLVSRGRDAQRRPVHLEAEVLDMMTGWIERYRRRAEARFRRLDDVLAAMPPQDADGPAARRAAPPAPPTGGTPSPAAPRDPRGVR